MTERQTPDQDRPVALNGTQNHGAQSPENLGSDRVSLDEIRDLIKALPSLDVAVIDKFKTRNAELLKPVGALGRLEDLALWMAQSQARHPARLQRPRIAVYAANHGIAAQNVSAFPAAVTEKVVQACQMGLAGIAPIAQAADADLMVYEMGLDTPTQDFTKSPAMSDEECARAIAYGMMAVEPGIDLLCVGEIGIGNTTSGAAMAAALFGGAGADWVGPGSGVTGAALQHKQAIVDQALALHKDALSDPLDIMRCLGGFELAAILGAVIAARMAKVPVLLDGFTCSVAAAPLAMLRPDGLDHCQVGHLSPEPGHRKMLDKLEKEPILDMKMRLGEGTGAAVAISILKAAVATHADMGRFQDLGL